MNAERRKRLAHARELIIQAQAIIQECGETEGEAFEALPETLQNGERGQAMSTAASALEELVDELTGIESALEDFTQ